MALLLVGIAFAVSACTQSEPASEPTVKSVKTIAVKATAGERIRVFSGRAVASVSAVLSFPVSGTVDRVEVNPGDMVKPGQLIASIDSRAMALEVDAATADLRKAQSVLTQRANTLHRNQELLRKGYVSEAVVEQSESDVAAARSDVAYRNSKLDRSRLALADARLLAPFAGVIGERFVQPNEEVAAGKGILTLVSEAQLEVEVAVPEVAVAGIANGMPAVVTFGAVPDKSFEGAVREIGRVAGAGNLYLVKIALRSIPNKLRAGMTAEVRLITPGLPGEQEGFLVPASALEPGQVSGEGHVFVFDADAGVARRTPVQILSVRDNNAVVKGVNQGQRVIVAGVPFLSNGQRVKPMADPAQ